MFRTIIPQGCKHFLNAYIFTSSKGICYGKCFWYSILTPFKSDSSCELYFTSNFWCFSIKVLYVSFIMIIIQYKLHAIRTFIASSELQHPYHNNLPFSMQGEKTYHSISWLQGYIYHYFFNSYKVFIHNIKRHDIRLNSNICQVLNASSIPRWILLLLKVPKQILSFLR